ncbi:hypothetical protein Tco_0335278 [Tanacetum coccineum]
MILPPVTLQETPWPTVPRRTKQESLKRLHFVNFVVILRKEDEVREEENMKPNATEYDDHEMTAKAKERLRKIANMSLRKRSKKKKRRKRRT